MPIVNRKVKLCFLNDCGNLAGGAEKMLLNVAKVLDRKKYEADFVFGSSGEIQAAVADLGYRTHVLRLPNLVSWRNNKALVPLNLFIFIRAFFRLWFFLLKTSSDYVITNSIRFELMGSVAARLAGKRLLWHTHNIQPPGWRRRIIRLLASAFPVHLLAVSDAVKASYRGSSAFSKIVVVKNGIEVPPPGSSVRGRRDNPSLTVLMLSALTSWKGHSTLISALDCLSERDELHGLRVLIAGDIQTPRDKEYKDMLLRSTQHLTEAGVVQFFGKVSDVEALLANADVLLSLSTRPDPFPTVLLEAMSYGIPCIATNLGGQTEIITNERNGLIIEPGDPLALADALSYLRQNRSALTEYSENCLSDFKSQYTLERYKERYSEALDRICLDGVVQ